MRSVSANLASSVKRLRIELELFDVLQSALEQKYREHDADLRAYVARAKRQTYVSTLIGVYGLIEETVDALLIALAEGYVEAFPLHGDLPEGIRNEHRRLLLAYLQDGDSGRHRGTYVEHLGISALSAKKSDPTSLLAAVFTYSTANYRAPYVRGLFNRLGVDTDVGLNLKLPTHFLDAAGFSNYDSFLEDLTSRRNQVAHSFGDGDTLSPEVMAAYVEIAFAYLSRLERIVNRSLLIMILDRTATPVGSIVQSWTGRVGLALTQGAIKVGDRLLILSKEWCTSHSVASLMEGTVSSHSFRNEGAIIFIGVGIGDTVPNSATALAYVLPDSLAEYWPDGEK